MSKQNVASRAAFHGAIRSSPDLRTSSGERNDRILDQTRKGSRGVESSSLESEGEGTADATGERGRDRGTQPGSPVRTIQLAEWGINSLPEYQRKAQIPSLPHQPRNTLQNDLMDLIEGLLTNRTPKEAMEFLLETPWDASDGARPTVEDFQKLTEPGEAAAEILENLTERMRWWSNVPD